MDDSSKQRIQKVLAAAGVASRRACEELVTQGRVTVNGQVVRQLPIMVDPATDEIRVDGERVKPPEQRHGGKDGPRFVYVMLNKPKKVVSTNSAQGEQTRAIDLLPPNFPRRVFPVGRLDAESEGLLLLTDDGELTNLLTHPRFGVPKTYKVVCDGDVSPETLRELEEGVWLADPTKGGFKTTMSRVKLVHRGREKSTLEITLKEGRNRQIRRMLAAMGHKVRTLKRTRLGPLKLEKLPVGASRLLTPREITELREAVARRQSQGPRKPRS